MELATAGPEKTQAMMRGRSAARCGSVPLSLWPQERHEGAITAHPACRLHRLWPTCQVISSRAPKVFYAISRCEHPSWGRAARQHELPTGRANLLCKCEPVPPRIVLVLVLVLVVLVVVPLPPPLVLVVLVVLVVVVVARRLSSSSKAFEGLRGPREAFGGPPECLQRPQEASGGPVMPHPAQALPLPGAPAPPPPPGNDHYRPE